ncbi:hypothetical protein BDV18DRAFT_159988 [Aspergillus unguis]
MFTLATLTLLTSSALAAPSSPLTLTKRIDLSCTDNGGGYRPFQEAQNCVDYLFDKGDDTCTVSGDNSIFCQAGDTIIAGSHVGAGGESSLCRDVAYGAQAIIDSCTTPEGYVGGYNAARGNGDLIVSINHK